MLNKKQKDFLESGEWLPCWVSDINKKPNSSNIREEIALSLTNGYDDDDGFNYMDADKVGWVYAHCIELDDAISDREVEQLRKLEKFNSENRHPHYDVIEEWARTGAQVQTRCSDLDKWITVRNPTLHRDQQYRIKPEETIISYRRFLKREGDNIVVRIQQLNDNKSPEFSDSFIRWIDEDPITEMVYE